MLDYTRGVPVSPTEFVGFVPVAQFDQTFLFAVGQILDVLGEFRCQNVCPVWTFVDRFELVKILFDGEVFGKDLPFIEPVSSADVVNVRSTPLVSCFDRFSG